MRSSYWRYLFQRREQDLGKLRHDNAALWVWWPQGTITSPRTEGQEKGVVTWTQTGFLHSGSHWVKPHGGCGVPWCSLWGQIPRHTAGGKGVGEGQVEHGQHTICTVLSEHISLLPSLNFILKSSLADHGASCQTCSSCFERCLLLFARSLSLSYHQPRFRQPNPVFGYCRWSQLLIPPVLLSLPKLKTSTGRRNENTWSPLWARGGFLHQLQGGVDCLTFRSEFLRPSGLGVLLVILEGAWGSPQYGFSSVGRSSGAGATVLRLKRSLHLPSRPLSGVPSVSLKTHPHPAFHYTLDYFFTQCRNPCPLCWGFPQAPLPSPERPVELFMGRERHTHTLSEQIPEYFLWCSYHLRVKSKNNLR